MNEGYSCRRCGTLTPGGGCREMPRRGLTAWTEHLSGGLHFLLSLLWRLSHGCVRRCSVDGSRGDANLTDITLPGSHASGVYKVGPLNTWRGSYRSLAVCQEGDFRTQANAGCRFFDCRVFIQFKLLPCLMTDADTMSGRLRMGHFALEKGLFGSGLGGAYGGSLRGAIDQAVNFVKCHKTECIILRFCTPEMRRG